MLHHAQRDMTFWDRRPQPISSTNCWRLWMAVVALAIGVPPQQFPLVPFVPLVESLSHANLRWSWAAEAPAGESPFHRVHHGVSIGHGKKKVVSISASYSPFGISFSARADFRNAYP